MNSCSIGVYGELARYPLHIQRFYRIIKYWCTLRQFNNITLIKLYDSGLADCLLGHTNWVSNVKRLLDYYGFSNVFTASNSEVLKTFPLFFEHRVIDCFVQEWQGKVDRSAVLDEYKLYTNVFSFEAYLVCVPKDIRMYLTRFRISSHSLRIQTGRYEKNKIARNEIYCMYCGSRDIEDTYHYVKNFYDRLLIIYSTLV